MDRRTVPSMLASLIALGALFAPVRHVGEPPLLGQMCAPEAGDRVFFAMSIADEAGVVLAEPKLLGMCGVPLEMTLADPGRLEEPRMSLLLEPQPRRDGSLDVVFELFVQGRVDAGKGRVRVRPGEERSTRLTYPGGSLQIQLAAFQVPSAEFRLYLEHGQQLRHGPGRT